MEPLHNYELSYIQELQSFRNPLLDAIFFFLNIYDTYFVYVFLTILTWNIRSEKDGFHLLYLLIMTTIIINHAKTFFAQPRPYHLMPSLEILGARGFGIPSGAAATILVVFGYLFFRTKPPNYLLKIAASLLIVLVGITRVYLGAHFPSDVVGGYLIGFLILKGYSFLHNHFARKQWSKRKQFLFHCFILLIVIFPCNQLSLNLSSLLLGAIIFHLYLHKEIKIKPSRLHRYLSAIIGMSGIIILWKTFMYLPNIISDTTWYTMISMLLFLCVGLWIGVSAQFLKNKKNLFFSQHR